MIAVPKQEVVRFTLDGQEIEAYAGETIWQAAARYGTKIPHLCYSPEPGYRADGNCRACMVEVEGERVLAASCIRPAREGMVVKSASERAEKARAMVFELLVSDQPERATSHDPASPKAASRRARPGSRTTAIPPWR
jgi:formate dehydrogenase major subunit